MSDKLIMDPNELYKLYDYRNIEEYYHFDFLSNFNSIEIDIFYDILNCLSNKDLSNVSNYIFRQWSLFHLNLLSEEIKPIKRKKELLKRTFDHSKYKSKCEFNTTLNEFIQGDKILSLYVMNQLLKFLYPCN